MSKVRAQRMRAEGAACSKARAYNPRNLRGWFMEGIKPKKSQGLGPETQEGKGWCFLNSSQILRGLWTLGARRSMVAKPAWFEKPLDPGSAEEHDGKTCPGSLAVWVLERLWCSYVVIPSVTVVPPSQRYLSAGEMMPGTWKAVSKLSCYHYRGAKGSKVGVYSTSCGVKDDILCISAWPWSSWLTSLSLFPQL